MGGKSLKLIDPILGFANKGIMECSKSLTSTFLTQCIIRLGLIYCALAGFVFLFLEYKTSSGFWRIESATDAAFKAAKRAANELSKPEEVQRIIRHQEQARDAEKRLDEVLEYLQKYTTWGDVLRGGHLSPRW